MGEHVTREECDRTHAPLTEFKSEFKKETNDNFNRLHLRIDKIYVMIVGVLLSIIAGIAIQVIITKITDKPLDKIEIVIDKSALNSAKEK